MLFAGRFGLGFDGEAGGITHRSGGAAIRHRAEQTGWRAGGAEGGTELHEGLGPGAGARSCGEVGCEAVDGGAPGLSIDRQLQSEPAGEHAEDVAIDGRDGLSEGDRGDGAGRIGADAGDALPGGGGGRNRTAELSNDEDGAGLQVAGASVVAEPLPLGEDGFGGGGGEGGDGGEGLKPAVPVSTHGLYAGLLQHDLGDPDGVGVAGAAPGEIALVNIEPSEQGGARSGE